MSTRRDQTCRSWIARRKAHGPWHSYVSLRGTTHSLTTGTRNRRAARDFNMLHLSHVLSTPKPTPESTTP